MHASLALLYPLLCLAIFVFAEGEAYKKEEGETDLQKNNQGWVSNVNLRSVCESQSSSSITDFTCSFLEKNNQKGKEEKKNQGTQSFIVEYK